MTEPRISPESSHAVAARPASLGFELGLVLGACRRRWRTLLVATLFVYLPTVAWILLSPPAYEAQLQLLVKSARLESQPDRNPLTDFSLQAELGTEIEVLRSRSVFERVVIESGLVSRETEGNQDVRLARAVQRLDREIDTEALPKTHLIALRYTDRDPLVAAQVLNLLATSYLEKHVSLRRNPKAVGFYDTQIHELSSELQTARTQLDAFKRRHDISMLELQKELNLRRVDELQAQVGRAEAELQGLEQIVGQLERRRAKRPFQSIEEDYLKQEASLLGARARRDELRKTQAKLEAQQNALDNASSEYESLKHEVEIANNTLVVYRSRLEEERIETALDRERILEVAVVDAASPPPLPVDRYRIIVLALGLGVGLLTGCGAAVLADRSARPGEEVEDADEALIPQIALEAQRRLRSSD